MQLLSSVRQTIATLVKYKCKTFIKLTLGLTDTLGLDVILVRVGSHIVVRELLSRYGPNAYLNIIKQPLWFDLTQNHL